MPRRTPTERRRIIPFDIDRISVTDQNRREENRESARRRYTRKFKISN